MWTGQETQRRGRLQDLSKRRIDGFKDGRRAEVGNPGQARASGDGVGDLATQVVRGRRAATSGARATLQTRQRGRRASEARATVLGARARATLQDGRRTEVGNAGRPSGVGGEGEGEGEGEGDGVGGEGDSPARATLQTWQRRSAVGSRGRGRGRRGPRTIDGDGEVRCWARASARRRARIGTVRDSFLSVRLFPLHDCDFISGILSFSLFHFAPFHLYVIYYSVL